MRNDDIMEEYNPTVTPNREKRLSADANELVERAFGIDIAEFVRIHEEAERLCPLCVREIDINSMVIDLYPPFEDKRIRGIICMDCKKLVTAINEYMDIVHRLQAFYDGDFEI